MVQRRTTRGQTMLIFALSSVALFVTIGLGVDAAIGYYVSAKLERAAAAGSLAGVPYMPKYYTVLNPLTARNAQDEALLLAQENGFVPGGGTNITVASTQVPDGCTNNCYENRLKTTVCADVSTTFLRLIGFSSHRECRSDTAEYLRPLTLGQPGTQAGSDLNSLGSGNSYYFLRTEGWNTDRGQGDAMTPNPADPNGGGAYNSTDVHTLSTAMGTEIPLSSFPQGANSVSQRGGYNFQIYVPAGQTAYAQVFNPIFGPDGNSGGCPGGSQTNGAGYSLHECDSTFNNGSVAEYSAMSYTLFEVPDTFHHALDKVVSQATIYPIDARGWASGNWIDMYNSGSGSPQANPAPLPDLWHQWVDICNVTTNTPQLVKQALGPGYTQDLHSCGLTGGANGAYYRLRVDTLDYNGLDPQLVGGANHSEAHKGTAVGIKNCATCTMGGISDLGIFTPIKVSSGSGSFQVPLLSVPPEYAGQTVFVDIFDPGDVSCSGNGCNQLDILNPSGVTATLGSIPNCTNGGVACGAAWLGPSENNAPHPITVVDCLPTGPAPPPSDDLVGSPAVVSTRCSSTDVQNNKGKNSTPNIFNGTWLRYAIKVPDAYAPGPNPANWFWSLRYTLSGSGASAGDTVTVSVAFNGSPVHLI